MAPSILWVGKKMNRRTFLKSMLAGAAALAVAPVTLLFYGEISPRSAAYASAELLKRARPGIITSKFCSVKTLPRRGARIIKFRRYK